MCMAFRPRCAVNIFVLAIGMAYVNIIIELIKIISSEWILRPQSYYK